MNKIYKVVWNTVRNCYVVGSELISSKSGRHSTSNGKSSSLKVTLTVLALCGMTALGSGVAPAYAADAGAAVESQYVAVLVNDSNNSRRNYRTFDGHSYHKETVSGETYWVRDGYTIKYEENKRYPGALKDNIIKAYKTTSYTANSDAGLLKSNQVMVESAGISTLTGVDLDDVSGGTYVGATNSGSTSTPSSFTYMIKDDNGTYVDAGNTNFSKRFKAARKNTDGTYSYKGEVVANDNLYVVNEQVGVFLTSSGKVYTGKVFGANNEVLMTTKSDSGTMYSYWGADTPDPNTKLADMTIGQFNQALEKVNNNSKAVAGDTIKEIKTTAKTDGGGTIDLVRRGQYNSATGQYEGEHKVGSGITITSHGGTNGEDVKINFSNGTTGFDVAAGSKVEAVKAMESATDITGLTINGETYNIKTGQTYTEGDNITIDGNKISATDTTLVAGKAEKKGDSYIVKDTAGNEVTLEDVASASKLTEVNNQVTKNTQDITNNTNNITNNANNITNLGKQLEGAVMYDSTATGFDKNNVTLGGTTYDSEKKTGGTKITNLARGTNDSDAVNFSQLKEVQDAENYVISGSLSRTDGTITLNRLNDGPVTISGLQDYVKGIDSYVTNATLSGDTLTLSRNQGLEALTVDLSSLTAKMSGTDYRVVENPAEGSDGIYKPNDKGNIELTVEDVKSGKTTTIQLSDIASVTTVDSKITNTTQTITNEYTTAITNAKTEIEEKIEGAKVHYYSVNPDSISGKDNYDNDGAVGVDSIAVGASAYADGRLGAAAFGNRSNANGERALAVGYGAKAEGMDTIAIGSSNNGSKGAKGTNSIAIGAQADANGTKTIFRGKEYTGTWGNATALGAYTEAGAGATALGASSKARGFNATAVGIRAEASAANSVALGNASSALREADAKGAYDYVGYSAGVVLSDGEKNSTVWHANLGAVSIGNEAFATGETDEDGNLLHFQYTRQLTGLAAGTADTDAVNVAQLKKSRVELTDGTNTTVKSTNDQTDGHVIYSVDVKTNGTINEGDTNIVTGDTVYNALQNVSWKAQVNGSDAKIVAKDGTLNFVNGDNIAITSNDNGDIKISTTGLASSGDLWTAQAGGKDVKAVNQKVNFVGSDHITVTGTDGQIKFETTGLADTDFTNITNTAVTKIKNLAKGEDRHIEAKEYAVDKDGSVTMTYVDGNGNQVAGTAKITGIAKSDLNNITEGGKTVINKLAQEAVKVVNGTNTTVTEGNDGKAKTYAVNVDNAAIQAATDVTGENGISVTSAVENGVKKYTVSAKLSNNFAIDQATGNIDLAPSIAVGKTNPVTINGNTGEITGLSNKTTTAANFADGSGRAATEEQLKEVNSKATAAKTTVTAGKNIDVNGKSDENGSAYTVALADDVSLGNNAIQLKGTDGSISAKSGGAQLAFNSSGLTVSQAKNGLTNETRIDGATITVDGGAGNQTIINGSTARIGSVLVNGGSGTATISGLTNQTTNYTGFANGSGRAATEEQLKEVAGKAGEAIETAGKGWNLTTNGKESGKTNIKPDGTVDFSSGNDNLIISNAGANLSFSLSDNLDLTNNKDQKGSVKVGENTALSNELLQVGKDVSLTASALNVGNSSLTTSTLMVGGLTYINSSGINANNRVISNVAAGTLDTDAVNVGQLKSAISGSQVSIDAGTGIIVEKTGNKYTIKTNIEGLSNDHGTVTVSTNKDSAPVTDSGASMPAHAKRMNLMLMANDLAEVPETTTLKGDTLYVKHSANSVKLITDEIANHEDAVTLNDGEKIDFVGGKNITTSSEHGTDANGKNYDKITFSLKDNISVTSVTTDKITINNGPTINSSGIDMNNQKITNLKNGEIAEGSKDAVNGGQIYDLKKNVSTNTENINILNEAVVANAENINSLSHSLNKLDSRINRVGAGAAALAALHPLDFDPDNKWDFAAGYGNYAGANAVAIGTYYRPNENTMFSIGGSFGGGENMINAGVSFKLGSGSSGITTSKTVMAKKIKEQDELLKAQDAKMKEQDEKIAKLEALVAQQGEMIQQALGKK